MERRRSQFLQDYLNQLVKQESAIAMKQLIDFPMFNTFIDLMSKSPLARLQQVALCECIRPHCQF